MSALCADCGRDTTPMEDVPGAPSSPWIGEGTWEWYMVHDEVWAAAGMRNGAVMHAGRGFLCVGCLEARLGRRLRRADFTDAPVNWPSAIDTPRMWLAKS